MTKAKSVDELLVAVGALAKAKVPATPATLATQSGIEAKLWNPAKDRARGLGLVVSSGRAVRHEGHSILTLSATGRKRVKELANGSQASDQE